MQLSNNGKFLWVGIILLASFFEIVYLFRWLGEILKNKHEVNMLLEIDDSCEFMALIAFGIPDETPLSKRSDIKSLMLIPPV